MKKLCVPLAACLLILAGGAFAAQNENQGKSDHDEAVMAFFRGDPEIDFPEPAPLLVNAQARDYRSLNGPWEYIVDEPGMSWGVITKGDYFTNDTVYPETGMRLKEHSFDDRKELQVPGDWNTQVPELDRYRGMVLYHREVEVDKQQGEKYLLHFGGANYTTDLFVNNELVGRHEGGYTPFNFDITDHLQSGENTIIVRVDAHLDDTTIPTMRTSDFWKYGGLTRDVGLITLPQTHIGQYQVYLHDRQKGRIRGWIQLEGESTANRTVTVSIPDADIETRVKTNGKGRAEFSVRADDLKLWSPKSPHLYDVKLALGESTVEDRIGFRTVSTDGQRILLNGKPIRIRGISMHEETILHEGLSHSREDVKAQFELVKDLNANFVRLAHYPHNEHTVRLADEMGIMLWSEVPIVSMIDWDNPDTLEVAKSQITENVTRDLNRASVMMWSIANESYPQNQERLEFLNTLAATARKLDASNRPLAAALLGNPQKEFREMGKHLVALMLSQPDLPAETRERLTAMAKQAPADEQHGESGETLDVVVDDPLGEVVDIVGYNEYFGWYYSGPMAEAFGVEEGLVRDAMLTMMPRIRFGNAFDKPMIVSEFGAGAKAGLHSDDAIIWSEEYQARVYAQQLEMLEKSPAVQGFTPWVLKDFRSHLRELNGIQNTYNRKGLVSETGEKKKAFHVLAEHYRQREKQNRQSGNE